MKDIPILMKSAMVCALLDDQKTNTRRLNDLEVINQDPDSWTLEFEGGITNDKGEREPPIFINDHMGDVIYVKPRWCAGDTLWVRETWQYHLCLGSGIDHEEIHYRADGPSCPIDGTCIKPWRPSIFMSRAASRIQLKVINVRHERLQNISKEDAIAEGIEKLDKYNYWLDYSRKDKRDWLSNPISSFATLWDSINAKRGYPWCLNPWVRRIEFRRVTP